MSRSGASLSRRTRWLTIAVIAGANAIGTLVVATFALLVLPKPDGEVSGALLALNLGLAGLYLFVAIPIGVVWGRRRVESGRDGTGAWLVAEREPDAAQRAHVLRAPTRITFVQVALWAPALVGFAVLDGIASPLLGLGVALTVALGGLTVAAFSYLLAELALRPVVARALTTHAPDRVRVPGIATRSLLTWTLGTAVPVFGLVLTGVVAFTEAGITVTRLAIVIVVLGPIALVFGALATLLSVYATVQPVLVIRRALRRVEEGDYGVEVAVTDGSEIGELQSGFNAMAAGLRERERMRDLFGRQVGTEVARRALERETELGGETREVAVLFVDLVGSTSLAARREPEEVVALLNGFFADVVDAVEGSGGWINKFQGDAALAIFGAPLELEGKEGRALRAARELRLRLVANPGELDAGIGVASGLAVAGHVGAERRFEYTVIGDAVNEAARLSELAKQEPGRVLASGRAVDRAGAEAGAWTVDGETTLRGRAEPTRLARPTAG